MSLKITGVKVGKTDITSTYTDGISQSDIVRDFTVTAVSLDSISPIDDNFIYNGSEIKPKPIIYAVVNGETVELHEEKGDYVLSYSNNKNVGTATVTAMGIGNYSGSVSTTFVINPKVVNLQWGETSWVYDGTTHNTTCVVENLVSGDICTVTLSGNSITNIGQTTVTATGLSNGNYTLLGTSNTSVILTILAGMFVKISGVWTPVKKVYKKVSGSWVQQELDKVFSTSEVYKKMD